jgi:acyl carrier protein
MELLFNIEREFGIELPEDLVELYDTYDGLEREVLGLIHLKAAKVVKAELA